MAQTRKNLASAATMLAVLGSSRTRAQSAPTTPDAKLIGLCGEFIEVEPAWRAIYDGPGAIMDDNAAEVALDRLGRRMNALLKDLAVARAVAPEGIAARARALAVHNGDFGFSFDHQDTMAGRLLACLLRNAAAVDGGTAA